MKNLQPMEKMKKKNKDKIVLSILIIALMIFVMQFSVSMHNIDLDYNMARLANIFNLKYNTTLNYDDMSDTGFFDFKVQTLPLTYLYTRSFASAFMYVVVIIILSLSIGYYINKNES